MGCIGPLFFLQTYAVWPQGTVLDLGPPFQNLQVSGGKKCYRPCLSTKNSRPSPKGPDVYLLQTERRRALKPTSPHCQQLIGGQEEEATLDLDPNPSLPHSIVFPYPNTSTSFF